MQTAKVGFRNLINSLKLQDKLILAFTVIVALPMVFISYFSYVKYKSILYQEIKLSFQQTIKQVNENINYKLTFYKDFSDYITYSDSINGILLPDEYPADQNEVVKDNLDTLKKLINSALLNLKEIDDLRIYKSNINVPTDGYYIFDESDITGEEWYNTLISKEKRYLWIKEYDNFTKSYVVSYISTIFDYKGKTGKFSYKKGRIGVLKLEFSTKQIINILKNFNVPGGRIAVSDENGNILFNSQNENIGTVINDFSSKIKGNKSGVYEIDDNNQKQLVIFDEIGVNGWQTVMYIPIKNVYSRITDISKYTMVLSLISFVFAIVCISIVSRLLLRRLYQLKNKIAQIKNGNIEYNEVIQGADEIAELDKGFNEMLKRLKQLLKDIYNEKALKKEAELKSLQAQINPHFLYNTLESIKCSVDMDEKENAIKMIIALKNLFRIGVNSGKEFITLAEEIKHAKSYLEIQKFRYGDKFESVWEIDEKLLDQQVIKTIFQPIIENSLYHAFGKMKAVGIIHISVKKASNCIEIVIKDNGEGINYDKMLELQEMLMGDKDSKSVGLKNVNDRIKLYYGNEYGIKIYSRAGEGASVFITFPFEVKPQEVKYV